VFVSHADNARRGDSHASYRLPARPVEVRDTTGAGDAFNGALAASFALDAQRPFEAHLRYAVAYAGLSTERPGAALSMPLRDEVVARFGDVG
jgi:ribokinase